MGNPFTDFYDAPSAFCGGARPAEPPAAPPGRFPPEGKEDFNAFGEDGRDRWHGPGAESSALKRCISSGYPGTGKRARQIPLPRPVFYVKPTQNPPHGLPGPRRVFCRLSSDLCVGARPGTRLRLPSCLLRGTRMAAPMLRRQTPAITAAGAVPDSDRFPLRALFSGARNATILPYEIVRRTHLLYCNFTPQAAYVNIGSKFYGQKAKNHHGPSLISARFKKGYGTIHSLQG
mgnify:CR=1 FL=1